MWNNLHFKHYHKFQLNKFAKRNKVLNNGVFGLQILESGFISPNEFQAIYFFLRKTLKKSGKVWFNFSPNYTQTSKPIETRMGKGKGNIKGLYSVVHAGSIILEIKLNSDEYSRTILNSVRKKISLKTRIVKKNI